MNEEMIRTLEAFMNAGTKVRVIKKDGTYVDGKIVYLDRFAIHVRNVEERSHDIVPAEEIEKAKTMMAVLAER